MIRYYKMPQRSELWFKYRQDKWTGSTAIDLLSGKEIPPEKHIPDNKYMLRGRVLEPLAIEAYERKYKVKVAHYGFITNSKYPHAGYSPDGIEEGIVDEVKCLGLEKHDAIIAGTLPIPTEYIAQMQFGLLITELEKAKLILYNPDSDTPLHVIDVLIESTIQDFMKQRLEETRPTDRPSATRAKKKYITDNSLKIREKRHKYYMKTKGV
jgi:hypothetical protein